MEGRDTFVQPLGPVQAQRLSTLRLNTLSYGSSSLLPYPRRVWQASQIKLPSQQQ